MLIETEKLTAQKLRELDEPTTHQLYCGLDCCLTLEVHEELSALLTPAGEEQPVYPLHYSFERALQAPALDMMLRGFKIDQYARYEGIERTKRELALMRGQLDDLAGAVWDKGLNPGSYKQLKDFFYGTMRLPEHWTSLHGEKKLSLNRESLEKLEQYFHARPLVALILECRDLQKKLSVLETEISPNGRMHTSYNIGGTNTGRWCLTADTEVLTINGWRDIASWDAAEAIAIYDAGILRWEICKKVSFPFVGKLVGVKENRVSFCVTPEHSIPYMDSHGRWKRARAKERKFLSRVPLTGKLEGLFLPEAQTRISVMMQADGHVLNANQVRWHFKKERKIARCTFLLNALGIEHRETQSSDGTTYIYAPAFDWLCQAKHFGPWVLQHNPAVFVDELQYWDGEQDRNGGIAYYTSHPENLQWVKTMAHLAGRYASVREKRVANARWNAAYRVFIGNDWSTRIYKSSYEESDLISCTVYCAETTTGAFLIRHKGEISVTGNSSSSDVTGAGTNLQNITPELRRMFVADRGWKLCGIDLEQAESREVGWLCGNLFGDWKYLDACEGGDLHTTTCKLIWPELGWSGDREGDRELAEQSFYRQFSYRDMSKRGGHGSNYYGTPYTMARHLKVPQRLMENFQRDYFASFSTIPRWHQWVAEQIQTKGELTTPFGRKRQFFGRRDDDTTLRKAIAFSPQSSTGDRLNLGLWRIWKKMPETQLLAQVHDAVYFQFRECDHRREGEIVRKALDLVQISLTGSGRTFTIPGEAKVGYNWAASDPKKKTFADGNPEGLIKWSAQKPDTRRRATDMERTL